MSSPTLPIAVTFSGPAARASESTKREPPRPPQSTA